MSFSNVQKVFCFAKFGILISYNRGGSLIIFFRESIERTFEI